MKKAVPIFIASIIILYVFALMVLPFISVGIFDGMDFFERVIALILPIIGISLIVMMFTVLKERLTEIDQEDKDDLSKY